MTTAGKAKGTGGGPLVWAFLAGMGAREDLREAATAAIEAGLEVLVVAEGAAEVFSTFARVRLLEIRGSELFEGGRRMGSVVTVRSRDDVDTSIGLMASGETVLLDTPDWTIIPLEDLVAAQKAVSRLGGLDRALAAIEALRQFET